MRSRCNLPPIFFSLLLVVGLYTWFNLSRWLYVSILKKSSPKFLIKFKDNFSSKSVRFCAQLHWIIFTKTYTWKNYSFSILFIVNEFKIEGLKDSIQRLIKRPNIYLCLMLFTTRVMVQGSHAHTLWKYYVDKYRVLHIH